MADPSEDSIKVVCRVRPMNKMEEERGSSFVLKFPSPNEDTVSVGSKVFTYDRVFKPDSSQELVYTHVAKQIVKDVLMGYNGTIFAYGQTSCGKTHTMEGIMDDPALMGVIPRIINDVFNHIYTMDESLEFHIKVSYFEIYMDKIRDLLDVSKQNLSVHEDHNRVPFVKGLTERFVSTPEEVLDAIEEGKESRHVAVTNMNEHSSRSHSVFLIHVKQENTETKKKLHGKLYLVDLAGSEKVSKTGAEGLVLDEAKNINKSLSALGNVIAALADGSKTHVPYRDSKLTRILQESLGGNARTTIVICLSPASFNETETKSTLLFGQRAKTIKNTVVVNEELSAEEWKRRYERERDKNARLRGQLARMEAEISRWRSGETVSVDEQFSLKDVTLEPSTTASTLSLLPPAAGGDAFGASLAASAMAASTAAAGQSAPSSAAAAAGRTGAAGGARPLESKLTATDLIKYEEEKAHWYAQLDEKDEEINRQSQLIIKLREQVTEQEEASAVAKLAHDSLQAEIIHHQKELEATKGEVQDVMQALEDLSLKLEDEKTEKENKLRENEMLSEDLMKTSHMLSQIKNELEQSREVGLHQRKRAVEMLFNLMSDINDTAQQANGTVAEQPVAAGTAAAGIMLDESVLTDPSRLDEDFMASKLNISKLKSEIKSLTQRCQHLDASRAEQRSKLDDTERAVNEYRLKMTQHELRLKSVQDSLRESDEKRNKLEASLEEKHEELAKLRAQEQMKSMEKSSAVDMKNALEEQLSSHREQHQRQISSLKDEVSQKQAQLDTIKEQHDKLQLEYERLQADHRKLRSETDESSKRLHEYTTQKELQHQAKQDLKGLEEAVRSELQTLYNLRRLFVDELQNKLKKGTTFDIAEIESGGSLAQKQKIGFLENNLEQLTKVHKQLVRDNADLRCEIPKLEKRMRATFERVKQLETSLKDARETAMRDRRRYQAEVDRIKEAVRQKNMQRRGHQMAQIAKVIKPGQPFGTVHHAGSGSMAAGSQSMMQPTTMATPVPQQQQQQQHAPPVIRGGQQRPVT